MLTQSIKAAQAADVVEKQSFLKVKLRSRRRVASSVNIHAWITVPTMEIIDASLSTSIAYFRKKPEAIGRILAKPADEVAGSAKPMADSVATHWQHPTRSAGSESSTTILELAYAQYSVRRTAVSWPTQVSISK
jgi:hypothetical protein